MKVADIVQQQGKIHAETTYELGTIKKRFKRDKKQFEILEAGGKEIGIAFEVLGIELRLMCLDGNVLAYLEGQQTYAFRNHIGLDECKDIMAVEEAETYMAPKTILQLTCETPQLKEQQLRKVMTYIVQYCGGAMPPGRKKRFSTIHFEDEPINRHPDMQEGESLDTIMQHCLLA